MYKVELKRDPLANMSYLTLPGHPEGDAFGCVAESVPLDQLINDYKGVDITLDFDKSGRLIGIEIFAA